MEIRTVHLTGACGRPNVNDVVTCSKAYFSQIVFFLNTEAGTFKQLFKLVGKIKFFVKYMCV